MAERTVVVTDLVTLTGAAERLGVAHATFYQWKRRFPGTFPDPVWSNQSTSLYHVDDLRSWMQMDPRERAGGES